MIFDDVVVDDEFLPSNNGIKSLPFFDELCYLLFHPIHPFIGRVEKKNEKKIPFR